jgi:cytidylate kinase
LIIFDAMTSKRKITIAIDGFSSSGKSTLAKDLAKTLGYVFIDSGAMYRGVTLYAIQNGFFVDETLNSEALLSALPDIEIKFIHSESDKAFTMLLNGVDVTSEIRNPQVSHFVSVIATLPAVRTKLVALQQAMGTNGGIVMDGRDIGTVVFPNAELKIFVTADLEIRAERRHKELSAKGVDIDAYEVATNLRNRDEMDTQRETSPLKQAPDAKFLDNSNMDRETQLKKALDWVTIILENA